MAQMVIDVDPVRALLSVFVPIAFACTDHYTAAIVSLVVIGFIDRALSIRRVARHERYFHDVDDGHVFYEDDDQAGPTPLT